MCIYFLELGTQSHQMGYQSGNVFLQISIYKISFVQHLISKKWHTHIKILILQNGRLMDCVSQTLAAWAATLALSTLNNITDKQKGDLYLDLFLIRVVNRWTDI